MPSVAQERTTLTQIAGGVLDVLAGYHSQINGPSTTMLSTTDFVVQYLDPIRELLGDANLVALVAHAEKINCSIQTAYNMIRYEYASRGLAAPTLPWRYDRASSLPAIRVIISNHIMRENAKALRGWQAAGFLTHILQAIHETEHTEESKALVVLAEQIITLSCELPGSLAIRGLERRAQLSSTDSWNVFVGSWNRTDVLICDSILPADAERCGKVLQGLRLSAFYWRLPDAPQDLKLLGVSSDATHPLSLIFESGNAGPETL